MTGILCQIILPVLLAAVTVSLVHPKLVKIARLKNIVDNPNIRKLNKEPIPVLGGVGVFIGIIMADIIMGTVLDAQLPSVVFAAATLMLYTGVIDDIFDIRPAVKFLLQILAVLLLMLVGGLWIDDFNGLWGIDRLPAAVAWPLTIVALVGIINGFNLIDGVDGLLSGFGIVTSICCGVFFLSVGDTPFVLLSFSIAGALAPFFMHNVFGRKFKMFLGDGGSLVLGILFAAIVARIVALGPHSGMKGVVSFVLAVFSLPVFDTLRVMIARMLKGRSPFTPDKTHLHHLFIDMGYSHLRTTCTMIGIDLIPVVVWLITERIHAIGIDGQFWTILTICIVTNIGIYLGVNRFRNHYPERFEAYKTKNIHEFAKHSGLYRAMRKTVDRI